MVIVGIITNATKLLTTILLVKFFCINIVAVARSKHSHPIGEAEVVKQKFLNIFKRFKKCYNGYSGGSMTQEQIYDLGKNTCTKINYYSTLGHLCITMRVLSQG